MKLTQGIYFITLSELSLSIKLSVCKREMLLFTMFTWVRAAEQLPSGD